MIEFLKFSIEGGSP